MNKLAERISRLEGSLAKGDQAEIIELKFIDAQTGAGSDEPTIRIESNDRTWLPEPNETDEQFKHRALAEAQIGYTYPGNPPIFSSRQS